uniref:Glucose-methanol-choline oxidoreductase N-terminal domain-containing protein n=1 Tax=Romanomermis culicivorax TaxID=13658 RepID=A0A915JEA9_ROMCU
MHLPTLLTLMNMYTNKFLEYPHSKEMPKVVDGLKPPLDKDFQNKFDFIIVGSGYTGSFLARRLGVGGCNKVLVVESGGMPNYDSTIPFMSMSDKNSDQTNFYTVPQKYAAKAMNDEKILISLPKNLGQMDNSDSSIYIPADLSDFQRWSQAYHLDGWSYNDMKKYAFTVSSSTPLSQPKFQKLFLNKNGNFKNADKSSDENLQDDKTFFNDKVADGFRDDVLEPLKFGWLKTAKIMDQSIIFDSSGRNILGVELKDENTGYTVFISARKQVILTSGAIGTAQLLLQSGVGPSDVLKKERKRKHVDEDVVSNTQIGLEVTITLVKTFSQGTMWLWRMSNDTFAARANPGYLSDKRDSNAMLAGK